MKEIIKLLTDNGYEAYIVGGFVRDYILGVESKDIDISTSAPIEEIKRIFKGLGKSYDKFFSYHIEENGYSYDITTFRKELVYKKNKPIEIEKTDNFKEDLLRRDFTINTFAINSDGLFIDLLNAKKDLDQKIIRVVGDTNKKFNEDKTRIIRAIRFACTLDFKLDNQIKDFLHKHSYLLNEVPREYIKSELDKIFNSNKYDRFFSLLKEYNISKYFNIRFNKIKPSYDKYGVWAQIETDLPLSNNEKRIISKIKELVSNKNVTFDDMSIYESSIIYNAVFILNLEDKLKSFNDIKDLHSIIDIDIDLDVIVKYFGYENIKKVYKTIERNIMEGKLSNNSFEIEEFLRGLKI